MKLCMYYFDLKFHSKLLFVMPMINVSTFCFLDLVFPCTSFYVIDHKRLRPLCKRDK